MHRNTFIDLNGVSILSSIIGVSLIHAYLCHINANKCFIGNSLGIVVIHTMAHPVMLLASV